MKTISLRRCELVNTRRKPPKKLRRVLASLQHFLYRLFNVGGFARSFRLLATAFRSFRCVALFLAFLSPFFCLADAVSDSLDRIDNNISNLSAKVDALANAIQGINANGGVVVSGAQDVDYYLEKMSDNLSTIQSMLGTSRIGLGRDVQTMRISLTAIQNTLLPKLLANSTSISNSLDQIASKLSGDYNLDDIWYMLNDIDGEIYYIADLISDLGLFIRDWGVANTNLLSSILEKIDDLVQRVNDVTEGAGSTGGGNAVLVEGTVDVGSIDGTVQLDPSSLWDFSWSFSGDYIKYLDRIAGKDKWHPDYIQTESATIYGEGGDYRAGVMTGFQYLLDLQREQLEASQRILLCLNPTNDLSSIKEDLEEKGNDGKQETDRVADEIKASADEFSDFTWDSRIEEGIENAFSPFLEYVNAPPEGVRFTVQGGSCMGFSWETFTFDCSIILNQEVAEFIRVWVLFFFYGGMIFLVLHVFPWCVARFATIVYYLSNINKNIGGG